MPKPKAEAQVLGRGQTAGTGSVVSLAAGAAQASCPSRAEVGVPEHLGMVGGPVHFLDH